MKGQSFSLILLFSGCRIKPITIKRNGYIDIKIRTEIAKELYASVSSVKNDISSILGNTGFRTLVKLAIHVIKEGLILPE